MIKLLFNPGTYGTYIASCILNYTSLAEVNEPIVFSVNGSSHSSRSVLRTNDCIMLGHQMDDVDDVDDVYVRVHHSSEHLLDYLNNQYMKQHMGEIIGFISSLMSPNEVNRKISENWQYDNINVAPRWVVREFLSYYIGELMAAFGYDNGKGVPDIRIDALELFGSDDVMHDILCRLIPFGITLVVSYETILQTHHQFIALQKFHNSQIKCDEWVSAVIAGAEDGYTPIATIIDEAYAQHIFRQNGYSIKCDGLDKFPLSADSMRKVIQLVERE